jgi:hypothetical protein
MAYRNRSRTRRIRAAIPVTLAGVVVSAHAAGADPRLAPPEQRMCEIVVVEPGDSMSKLGASRGLALAEVLGLNGHIENPNLIYPGDEIVVGCTIGLEPPPPAPVEAVPVNEVPRAPRPAPTVEWPGFNPFIPGEVVVDGVASQSLILRTLYDAGARGNQLIGLAAITEGESNRRLNAEGDEHLADRTWGPSVTPWQIRSANAQRGHGTARDLDALRADPLGHGAAAAIEIYDAALTAGRNPLGPWTAHLKGNDRSFIEPYRSLAEQMGLL